MLRPVSEQKAFTFAEMLMFMAFISLFVAVITSVFEPPEKPPPDRSAGNQQASETSMAKSTPQGPVQAGTEGQSGDQNNHMEMLGPECGSIQERIDLANARIESHFKGPYGEDPVTYLTTADYRFKIDGTISGDLQGNRRLLLVETEQCDRRFVHGSDSFVIRSFARR